MVVRIVLPPDDDNSWDTGAASPWAVETQHGCESDEAWWNYRPISTAHIGDQVQIVGQEGVWTFLGFRHDGVAVVEQFPRSNISTGPLKKVRRHKLRLLPKPGPVGGWPVRVPGAMAPMTVK